MKEEDKINQSCSICLTSVSDTPLFRNNPKGGAPDWRCRKHLDKKPSPELDDLLKAIGGH